MKYVLHIALNDLRLFLKEKSAYFWLFGSPLLFAIFIGFANRGSGNPSNPRPAVIFENRDDDFMGQVVAEELSAGGITLITNRVEKSDERRLTIPEGFTREIRAKVPAKIELAKLGSSGADASFIVELRLLSSLITINSYLYELNAAKQPINSEELAALRQRTQPVSLKASFGTRKLVPAGFNQSVPGILVMFTMMNLLIFGGAVLAGERRDGVLRRFLLHPVRRTDLILGKIAGLTLLGMVQIGFLLLAAKVLMRFNFGGNLLPLLLTMIVYSWVAAALGILIGSVIAREDKIVALCVLLSMVIAALGGCWWPLEIVPENVRIAGHLFPTAWTMDALHQLLTFGGGLENIWKALGVLVLYGVAATAAAVKFFRV